MLGFVLCFTAKELKIKGKDEKKSLLFILSSLAVKIINPLKRFFERNYR